MEIIRRTIANTYPTKRGDIIVDADALRLVRDQLAAGAGLVDIEHDPRNPPAGRLVSSEIISLPDGHMALEGTIELFDPADYKAPYPLNNIRLGHYKPSVPASLEIDEHYGANSESCREAQELADALGIKLNHISKNAMEPPTWLTVTIVAGLGCIAAGFLNELGKDAYTFIKTRVMDYFKGRRATNRDNLLIFEFEIPNGDRYTRVSVILTDPTDAEVARFLDYGVPFLDRELPALFARDEPLVSIALSFKESEISLLYAVRDDGLPLFPSKEMRATVGPKPPLPSA